MFNDERFKNIASGLQSLVIAGAVIVGGLWTATTFGLLRSTTRAELEVQKLDLELKKQANLELTIETQSGVVPGSTGHFICAVVSVRNVGTRNVTVRYPNGEPVRVWKVDAEGNRSAQFMSTARIFSSISNTWLVKGSTFRPGSINRYPFLIPVPEPGVYHLAFFAFVPPEEETISAETGGFGEETWDGRAIVVVPPDQDELPAARLTSGCS